MQKIALGHPGHLRQQLFGGESIQGRLGSVPIPYGRLAESTAATLVIYHPAGARLVKINAIDNTLQAKVRPIPTPQAQMTGRSARCPKAHFLPEW